MRPPIANIDTAIVVSACVEPDFSPNLLDRQLVMLESNNVRPVLFFFKSRFVKPRTKKNLNLTLIIIVSIIRAIFHLKMKTDKMY